MRTEEVSEALDIVWGAINFLYTNKTCCD